MIRYSECASGAWEDRLKSVIEEKQMNACRDRVLSWGTRGLFDDLGPVEYAMIRQRSYDIRERALAGISYIPEDRHGTGMVLDFTLQDNLALREYFREPFSAKGILNQDQFRKYADELIDRYDIRSGQGPATIVRSMSGGNQQKAIIGREIEEKSKLIIFVQPTRGLDIGAIENIHKQILQERDSGAAILLISLELDEIMELADTIGIIYRGELLKIAPAGEMTSHEVGRYMMGVKDA